MAVPTIGDPVPSADFLRLGADGVETVTSASLFAGRRVLVVGVIGAFTPVCTARHLPEYLPYCDDLAAEGLVDKVVCISVADPFVMRAWGEQLGVAGKIDMLTDFNAAFAESMGLLVDLSSLGLGRRSTRYALLADDGVIEILNVEATPGALEKTSADAMRKLLIAG
jgi:glutaredoxin/glutathione-dependent peroxiredoxin